MVVYILPVYQVMWQISKIALSLTLTHVCVPYRKKIMGTCVFRVVHRHYLRISILD